MVQTTSIGKKIYSVDMMFAYINIFTPKYVEVKVNDYIFDLDYKGWGNPEKNISYSPKDVLENPKKYSEDYLRIKNAELNYPIIIINGNIVDGIHRLTKAYLLNKKNIKAYTFDGKILNKFLINKNGDWNKVNKLNIYDYIELFYKRFIKKK
jgi:glutaredoxin